MNILAVVDNDLYLRNFVLSGAFDDVRNEYNFTLAISNATEKLATKIPNRFKTTHYLRNEFNKSKVQVFNQISMRHFKKKSSTFDIKTSKYTALLKDNILFNFFALPFVYYIAKKIILNQLQKNSSLEQIIRKTKPKIVLFPYSGYEATGYELVLLSKKYNFKTFFLTNGWDNLSSKGVLLLKPDYLGVWGQQALIDASEIHGMKFNQCFLTGCARYEGYFDRKKGNRRLFPFDYILFAGSTTAADEITPLQTLEQLLRKIKPKNLKIVYRPHPMRAPRAGYDLFNKNDYRYIIIDPQVADSYYKDKAEGTESGAAQNFPDLDYYPSLLKNALFLISPLSSLMIEGAIYDVPALVLSHNDNNPIPASLQSKWKHFEGATNIPGWFFASDLKEIKSQFQRLFTSLTKESPTHRTYRGILSEAIKIYLYSDNRSYSRRLCDYIKVVNLGLSNNNKVPRS